MTLAGTKYRQWQRRLEAARRKAVDIHHEICVRDPHNDVLHLAALQAVEAIANAIGIVAAIVEDQRDPRGKRPQT